MKTGPCTGGGGDLDLRNPHIFLNFTSLSPYPPPLYRNAAHAPGRSNIIRSHGESIVDIELIQTMIHSRGIVLKENKCDVSTIKMAYIV